MALKLKTYLGSIGKSQSDLARAIGRSPAMINMLCNNGFWPRTGTREEWKKRISTVLREWSGEDAVMDGLFEEMPGERANAHRAGVPHEETTKDDEMLLQNAQLEDATAEHFGLTRSPFRNEIRELDDIFATSATRRARTALKDAALNAGFLALIGESGSGKTTLRKELEARIKVDGTPVTVIKPYVAEMERSENTGKPMRSGQISEAIVRTLAPGESIRGTTQGRLDQASKLLAASRQAGYRNVLIIEEAHRMPLPTIRSLKSFVEMEDGVSYMLGVILIGQQELAHMLSERLASVREIVQRLEIRTMPPLDEDLVGYLTHKLARADVRYSDVFADDVSDAIRARLTHVPRGQLAGGAVSLCHPLVVNNLVTRAMNAAAAVAMPRVTADVIAGC